MEAAGRTLVEATSIYADLGPAMPSRLAVYVAAAEVHALARLALELSCQGPNTDVPRAARLLDKIRAVLGEGHG